MQKIFKKKLWTIIFVFSLTFIFLYAFYAYLNFKSPFLKNLTIKNRYNYIVNDSKKSMEFVIESQETIVAAYVKFSDAYPKREAIKFLLIDEEDKVLRSGVIKNFDDIIDKQDTFQFLFAENLNVSVGSKLVFSFENIESGISIAEIELLCRESLWKSVIGK